MKEKWFRWSIISLSFIGWDPGPTFFIQSFLSNGCLSDFANLNFILFLHIFWCWSQRIKFNVVCKWVRALYLEFFCWIFWKSEFFCWEWNLRTIWKRTWSFSMKFNLMRTFHRNTFLALGIRDRLLFIYLFQCHKSLVREQLFFQTNISWLLAMTQKVQFWFWN